MLTLFTTDCTVCRKRDKDHGGNGLCPVLNTHRAAYFDKFAASEAGQPRECGYFKIGDAKKKKRGVDEAQPGLF
jgi:hypothetical protein